MSTTVNSEPGAPSLSERRRQASRELMRAEILTAAQHIIRTQGLDDLSLRALAKAVGVTAPALYEYFDSKDAILRALFVQGSEIMLSGMDQVIHDSPPGLVQLQKVMTGYRVFARQEPDYFRLLFGKVESGLGLTEADYAGMQTIFGRFVQVIIACIDAGELQPLPPVTLSRALWAISHGAALLETESFMSHKPLDHECQEPHFDAAVRLTLLAFATPKGAALIDPVTDPTSIDPTCVERNEQ